MSEPFEETAYCGPTHSVEDNNDAPRLAALELSPEIEEGRVMARSQAFNLYTTHFLSTWNVRTYEFAAIIFTAAAYPDTLIAASIRGIVRTLASICFSSSVGRWIDHAPDRLKTLLTTISVNRFSVIGASVLWFFIVEPRTGDEGLYHSSNIGGIQGAAILKGGTFTLILLLGILENLSASGNMLSMERDWVIVASSPNGKPYDLTHLNSAMRRIDLICKLIAPLLISVVVSVTNVKIGVLVVSAMSTSSWAVELWCARNVWNRNPRLRVSKILENQASPDDEEGTLLPLELVDRSLWRKTRQGFRQYTQDFKNYFGSLVWVPSLSLAFLHISALTYSATFITYLLTAGFSLDLITIARATGSVVEISSTVVTPVGVQILSKAQNHGRFRREDRTSQESTTALLEGNPEEESRTETGLERLGLWGISWQLFNLVPVVLALWQLSPNTISSSTVSNVVSRVLGPMTSQPVLAFTMFFFLSLSRLGLWIYDLTTQQLTQTMVVPSQRSSFTGVEFSFVSLFELCHHIITIILHKPEQFKWIAVMSMVCVGVSTVMYAGWVWRMRGHLVHWERIGKGCECVVVRSGHHARGVGWRRRIGDTLSLRGRFQIR